MSLLEAKFRSGEPEIKFYENRPSLSETDFYDFFLRSQLNYTKVRNMVE